MNAMPEASCLRAKITPLAVRHEWIVASLCNPSARKRGLRLGWGDGESMKPLTFLVPLNGEQKKFTLPADYVETVMLPSAEHEAGQAITTASAIPGMAPSVATPAKQAIESQNSQRWMR
jgi:hypothetical protein